MCLVRDVCTILNCFSQVVNVKIYEELKVSEEQTPLHTILTILQDFAKASVQEDRMCSCSSSCGGSSSSSEADRVKWDNCLHGVCIQAAFGVCAHVCVHFQPFQSLCMARPRRPHAHLFAV